MSELKDTLIRPFATANHSSSGRKTHGSFQYTGVVLSYSQVYGKKPSWDDFAQAIAPYTLEKVVEIVCRISAGLYSAELPWDSNIQLFICRGIFGEPDTARILETAKLAHNRMKARSGVAPVLVFHEQQILTLLKAALIMKKLNDQDRAQDLISLGKAFLMITDLTEGLPGDLTSSKGEGASHDRSRWVRYILATTIFQAGSVDPCTKARSFDLYLSDKEHLQGTSAYIDLPSHFKSVTKMAPESFWAMNVAFSTLWGTLSNDDISSRAIFVDRNNIYTNQLDIDDDDIEAFLSLCATDIEALKIAVEGRFTLDDIRPFDILPFAQTPLVNFEGRIYVLSLIQLAQKMTVGLHYFYLDPRVPTEKRQQYLTYMGDVFEDYVSRCFSRIFPPITGRYLNLDDYRYRISGKYCDGIVVYEDAVVLIETKASMFNLEARAGQDFQAIADRLKDIVLDGARQIHGTIEMLKSGWRDGEGIIPGNISHYYPVIITLEEVFMNPLIHKEVGLWLDAEGLLHSSHIRPLQYFDAGVLDQLEGALQSGSSLKGLIDDKISDATEIDDSWGNFLHRRRDRIDTTNPYLEAYYSKLKKRALDLMEKGRF